MIQIPMYSMINRKVWSNKFSYEGCANFYDIQSKRHIDSTFEKFEWSTDVIKPGIEV